MSLTIDQLNAAAPAAAVALLEGIYEHSPWIAERALAARPFRSLPHLKHALVKALAASSTDEQIGLIRAHPELAGKAMVSKTLTAESTNEQKKAGLTDCTPDEFAKIRQLNADYNAKFGFPFILAVRGPRGTGLPKREIIETFERRVHHHPSFELGEALRNIHRIAAGLLACRPVLPVPERHLRRALCRRRPERRRQPEDDEHRHALQIAGAARPHHGAAAFSRSHRPARPGVGGPAHRHRTALETCPSF